MNVTEVLNDKNSTNQQIRRDKISGKLLYSDGTKWFTIEELSNICGLTEASIRKKINKNITVPDILKQYGNYSDIVAKANELCVSVYTLKKLIRVNGMSLEAAIDLVQNRKSIIQGDLF